MIDKYGEEVLRELEEEKQNKEEKEAGYVPHPKPSVIQRTRRSLAKC